MLCERCKKNESTFHKSVFINGTGYETNLCNDCARALDFDSAHIELLLFLQFVMPY